MAVIINSIEYANDFATNKVDWLLGNKYNKQTVTIDFTVATKVVLSGASPLLFGATNRPTLDYLDGLNFPYFTNFKAGDTILVSGTVSHNGTYIIIEKLSDYVVRTNTVFVTGAEFAGSIELTTPFKGISYFFGFIENNEPTNYNSKIDGSQQRYTFEDYSTGSTSLVDMLYFGSIESKVGAATLQRQSTGTATGDQRFKIVHTFYIDPVIIASQYEDAVDGIAPNYFLNSSCLKHVFKIDAAEDLTNPNNIQSITVDDRLGNTGWMQERFNLGVNNYSVDSVTYEIAGDFFDGLQVTDQEQIVTIVIKNTVDIPFSNNNTKFTANFSLIPEFTTDYIGNGNTLTENFFFDRALQTVGSAAVNGTSFGTDQQIIKEVTATFISTSEIEIVISVEMAAAAVANISARSRMSYNLAIAVQDHLLQTELADLVTLNVVTADFYINTADPTLINLDPTLYLRHYESDVLTEGTTSLLARAEDDVLAYSLFYIDRNGREDDDIKLSLINLQLVAKSTGGDEFILENYLKSVGNTQQIADGTPLGQYNTQFFDIVEDRNFKMPSGEQRKQIKLKRRVDLDTVDKRYYEIYYPFIVRYEDWLALSGVNAAFFDIAEPNNGFNNDWYRYSVNPDWGVFYRVKITATKNGASVIKELDNEITVETYLDNPDWINETITFKDSSNNILASGGQSYILGYEDTTIEIEMEYAGASAPVLGDVEWRVNIQPNQGEGSTAIRYLSSVYDWTNGSWLKSSDSSNLVVKSVAGLVYKATLKSNYLTLPDGITFAVSGRIFDKSFVPVPPDSKLMEDGTPKLVEAGDFKIIE